MTRAERAKSPGTKAKAVPKRKLKQEARGGGRPPERGDVRTPFRRWLEERAAKTKASYADTVTVVARELNRGRSHVYSLANGNTTPSRPLAALIERVTGGVVDAVRSW